MINGMFVIDGIVHPFDFRPERRIRPQGQFLVDNLVASVANFCPPGTALNPEFAMGDYSARNTTNTVFLESGVDVAISHHVPMYSYLQDGSVTVEKNMELVAQWPERYLVYAGVDPSTQSVQECIDSLERQVELIPSTIGLKLYPAQVTTDGGILSFSMEDEQWFPVWERARDLGLRVIAEHKIATYGPLPMNPFRVEDIGGAARAFPELNFEIVHGGLAFTEETASLVARFPNVYVNLETTSALLHRGARRFERVLAELMRWGGPEKIIWGTGAPIAHPRPLLEAFARFEFSEHTLETTDTLQITEQDKANILAHNYARMAGLDISKLKSAVTGDEIDLWRAEHTFPALYSLWVPEGDVV